MVIGKKIFFDVGAHIGYWTYIATSLGMQVVAFEPVKSRTNIIKEIKKKYNFPITILPDGTNLDEFVNKTGVIPDFIKIDVDGVETQVVPGAINLLKNYLPDLMIELRVETIYLLNELKKIGYNEKSRFGDDSICIFLSKN